MGSVGALPQVFEKSNLRRAWRWICTGRDQFYREACGPAYAEFSICPDDLLDDLKDRLDRHIYEPSPTRKVYFPKQDRTSRTYTILSTQDQIVYQAFVNIIADRFDSIAKSGYLDVTFNNLYAGRTSRTFYRDWRKCRSNYIRRARHAVVSGLKYTATFDIAACYDTIGHSVIRHFLDGLQLDRDFCDRFCACLRVWTINNRGILLDAGIPQGPLGSGLIAEVILRDFDIRFKTGAEICYLRYTDDIRLFGRSIPVLESRIRDLVDISKGLGLNPQASKMDVHLVEDLDAELKSISSPPEDWAIGGKIHQDKLVRRILELTRRSQIHNETRFKLALSHAHPSARLNARLVRTLDRRPDLFQPIVRYFRKYKRLPPRTGEAFAAMVRTGKLMPAVCGALLDATDGRLSGYQEEVFNNLAKALWNSKTLSTDVKMSVGKRLLKQGIIHRTRLSKMLQSDDWWVRSEFVRSLTDDAFPRKDLTRVLTKAVCDKNPDVALSAAVRTVNPRLKVTCGDSELHPFAARVLRRSRRRACGVDHGLRKMLGDRIPRLQWRTFLGQAYPWFEQQGLECERCSRTNVTAFVNALDALNDRLLVALFARDGRLGTHQLGNVGGTLSNRRLGQYYPHILKLVRNIHAIRGNSRYSHPVNRRTGKPTRTIEWDYLPNARKLLVAALRELAASI